MRTRENWDQIQINLIAFKQFNQEQERKNNQIPSSLPSSLTKFIVNNSTQFGYIMEKKDGSIDSLLKTFSANDPDLVSFKTMIETINKKLELIIRTPDDVFIHGDMKLENILYTQQIPPTYEYFIHDLDTVFIKKQKDIPQNPIKFHMDCTMIHAHPLLNYFVYEYLPMTNSDKTKLENQASGKIISAMEYWNEMTNIQIQTMALPKYGMFFKNQILTLLGLPETNTRTDETIATHYDNYINNANLMEICKYFDLHAFNSSLLYTALYESNKIEHIVKNNPGLQKKYQDKLATLIGLKTIARDNIRLIHNRIIKNNSSPSLFVGRGPNKKTDVYVQDADVYVQDADVYVQDADVYDICKIKTRRTHTRSK